MNQVMYIIINLMIKQGPPLSTNILFKKAIQYSTTISWMREYMRGKTRANNMWMFNLSVSPFDFHLIVKVYDMFFKACTTAPHSVWPNPRFERGLVAIAKEAEHHDREGQLLGLALRDTLLGIPHPGIDDNYTCDRLFTNTSNLILLQVTYLTLTSCSFPILYYTSIESNMERIWCTVENLPSRVFKRRAD